MEYIAKPEKISAEALGIYVLACSKVGEGKPFTMSGLGIKQGVVTFFATEELIIKGYFKRNIKGELTIV